MEGLGGIGKMVEYICRKMYPLYCSITDCRIRAVVKTCCVGVDVGLGRI